MNTLPTELSNLLTSKKALILTGCFASGKTQLAKFIAKQYQAPVLFLADNFRTGLSRLSFIKCKENTDLVIIEGCPPKFDFEAFFSCISRGIELDQGLKSCRINPKLLFISQVVPLSSGLSFNSRFDIFDLRDNPSIVANLPQSQKSIECP